MHLQVNYCGYQSLVTLLDSDIILKMVEDNLNCATQIRFQGSWDQAWEEKLFSATKVKKNIFAMCKEKKLFDSTSS